MSRNNVIVLVVLVLLVISSGFAFLGFIIFAGSSNSDGWSLLHLEQRLMCGSKIGKDCATCEDFPSEGEVRRVLQVHADEVKQIEDIHPGFIQVEVETDILYNCDGIGRIVIYFDTDKNKSKIVKFFDENFEFYGIPVITDQY